MGADLSSELRAARDRYVAASGQVRAAIGGYSRALRNGKESEEAQRALAAYRQKMDEFEQAYRVYRSVYNKVRASISKKYSLGFSGRNGGDRRDTIFDLALAARSHLDSPSGFFSWLDANNDTEVGTRISANSCPIAVFVLDTTGIPVLVFEEKGAVGSIDGPKFNLPLWAQRFVRRVDYRTGEIGGHTAKNILVNVVPLLNLPNHQRIPLLHTSLSESDPIVWARLVNDTFLRDSYYVIDAAYDADGTFFGISAFPKDPAGSAILGYFGLRTINPNYGYFFDDSFEPIPFSALWESLSGESRSLGRKRFAAIKRRLLDNGDPLQQSPGGLWHFRSYILIDLEDNECE
jgi:hypothetical protein